MEHPVETPVASTSPTTEEVQGVQRPFWLKLTVGASLLAIVPLLGVGIVIDRSATSALGDAERRTQRALVEDVASTLEASHRSALDGLDGVGRALGSSRLDPDTRLLLALNVVESQEAIDHAAIYDKDGKRIDVIREKEIHFETPETLDAALLADLKRWDAAVGEVRTVGDGPRVLTALPIKANDTVTGYVASWVSLEPVQVRVQQLSVEHFAGTGDHLFVLNEQKKYVVHADMSKVAAGEAVDNPLLAGMTPEMFHLGVTQTGDFVGPGEVPMVGSIKPLPHRPWVVMAQVPQDVVYEPVHDMERALLLAVVLAMVFAVAGALVFARQLSAPMRALVAFAGELARRNFGARIALGTKDEVAVLGQAMSAAAANLEESEARIVQEVAIRADLGRYLPKELVEGVVRREHDMALGGTRRMITVLFADVVAFTPLTERLEPEEVVTVLNQLFTILTEIVFRHGGTVDKFVGDCVMAFWNAPTPQEDHAQRAVAAAEDMLRFLEVGNAEWQQKYGVVIQLAIGVNTGPAVVGNIGSETRMEYTCIGDVVNVAARLEAVANPQQILVTDTTRLAAGDAFDYASYGDRGLSGRVGDIQVYEVLL